MNRDVLDGLLLDESTELTLNDLCRSCAARRELIEALVEEGVLTPVNRDPAAYRFPGSSLKLAIKAVRLHQDLGLNPPGVALALDLMAEIDRLRARLRTTGP